MDSSPTLRAVLLGASNLHHALRPWVGQLARHAGGPVEAWAAAGRGRSYGLASRFCFVRRLPGIVQSPLWQEIAALPSLPTVGLITDVGNDILYGAPVESILRWVETCLDRLAALEARAVVTLLPLARLERLSPAQFVAFLALFFPGRRASWEGTLQRARALNAGLAELARERGAAIVAPQPDWYGLDPIHIRRDRLAAAWGAVLHGWGLQIPSPHDGPSGASPLRGARGRGLRISRETRLFGLALPWRQPALRFTSGSRLFLL
jgi:hypothetical protein